MTQTPTDAGAPTASLIRRLILWLTAGTAVVWLVSTSLGLLVMRHELNKTLDSALQETAQRLLALAVHEVFEHENDDKAYQIAQAEIAEHDEHLNYLLRDASGRVLLRSHNAPASPFPAPLKTGFFDTPELRIYTEGTISSTIFIQVAEPHAFRREAIFESGIAMLAPLLLLIPLSWVAVTWIVTRAMVPVLDLKNAIRLRGTGNLSPIRTIGLPTELAPIAEAVDWLLERLRAALDAERAFAANSAHELRTPLASALAQVQRLAATLDDEVANERVRFIETDLKRLRDLTEKLLQLSRAEAGVALSPESVDLLPALRLVIDEFVRSGLIADRIIFEDADQQDLRARIDVDAFAIVMRNLIENALIHGNEKEPVRVFIKDQNAVHVVNAGPVVPNEQLEILRRRFARGSSGTKGSGLGLAIADTIMRQGAGRLVLCSPAPGRKDGFEAIAQLT